MATKSPWKSRTALLKDISSFIFRNGAFFKQNAKRMSDLFEMSIYNDVVKYYRRKNYKITICNMQNGIFRYKLSTAGLVTNFSFFRAEKLHRNKLINSIEIRHNIKLQSAYNPHIYYTADVSVCTKDGVTTTIQTNGDEHSYISPHELITFFEIKNMNPTPETLISFTGIVLEIKPKLIEGKMKVHPTYEHLTPSLVFSGQGSQHSEYVADQLINRYEYNIIRNLFVYKKKIYNSTTLNKYEFSNGNKNKNLLG